MPLRLLIATLLACIPSGCASADGPARDSQAEAPPAPNSAIPRRPAALAERLTTTHRQLDSAIERWRTEGDVRRGAPPSDVTLYALDEQRIHLLLSKRRALAARVLDHLPGRVAAHARATLRAKRALNALYVPVTRSHWRTGPARPAGELLGYYREARRRFGVPVHVLAAGTSSSPPSAACATPARPGRRGRCSSSHPPGPRTA